ncbi:hypothetical protein QE368_000853 [Asaia bogorensis NBRC 16594]|nr:hypothetical protein [Asaia bogorensis NBRC 16594]
MKEVPAQWTVIGFVSPSSGAQIEVPGSVMSISEANLRHDVEVRNERLGSRTVIKCRKKGGR